MLLFMPSGIVKTVVKSTAVIKVAAKVHDSEVVFMHSSPCFLSSSCSW